MKETLPPELAYDVHQDTSPREFRTALPANLYLQLEEQSMRRGLKPFKFVGIVMSMFLRGDLVDISKLNENQQLQIRQAVNTVK